MVCWDLSDPGFRFQEVSITGPRMFREEISNRSSSPTPGDCLNSWRLPDPDSQAGAAITFSYSMALHKSLNLQGLPRRPADGARHWLRVKSHLRETASMNSAEVLKYSRRGSQLHTLSVSPFLLFLLP